MTFGKALENLKKGKKVTRKIWKGYWFIPQGATFINNKNGELQVDPIILAKTKNDLIVPAQPYQVDLLANDWEVIK